MLSAWLLLFSLSWAGAIVLETPLGRLKGAEGLSRGGRKYHKFLGVRYAKPPTGNLRFKNPEPYGPWEGEDFTELPPVCIQVPIFFTHDRNVVGQEDCLFLNVFTPDVKPKELLPVMVYIHGGGFRCGAPGGADSGDFLVDEDVVFVNLQYRLGTLGFLSTEDEEIPGNFGLKDQALALRWIRDNIASFGGDPGRITIFGESAGGASTNFQMVAPSNRGLIKGVISESGTINRFWGLDKAGDARPKAFKVARLLECDAKTSRDVLQCLRKKDAADVIKAELDFIFWQFDPAVVFKPVVEPKWEGAFIDEDPLAMESSTPWMTGVTSAEGILRLGYLEKDKARAVDDFVRNIDTFLPRQLFLDESSRRVRQSMELIRERYFPDLSDRDKVTKGLKRIMEDTFFEFAMEEAVNAHKGPKYLYQFAYMGANSLMDVVSGGVEYDGVSHADELLMLFNWSDVFPKVKKGDEEMSKKVVRMWADFARYQNPTPKDGKWKPAMSREYLRIDREDEMRAGLGVEAVKFWSNLPLYRRPPGQRTEL